MVWSAYADAPGDLGVRGSGYNAILLLCMNGPLLDFEWDEDDVKFIRDNLVGCRSRVQHDRPDLMPQYEELVAFLNTCADRGYSVSGGD